MLFRTVISKPGQPLFGPFVLLLLSFLLPEWLLYSIIWYRFQVGYKEKFILRKSDDVLVQAAQGVVESPSLEVSENCGDVALRDVASRHGGGGLGFDLVILEV